MQTVGTQFHGINDDFHQIFASTLQCGIKHARHFLDTVAHGTRSDSQCTLWNVARKGYDQNREFGNVDFVDCWFVSAVRQVTLGVGDLVADIVQRLVEIGTSLKLDNDIATTLIGSGAHFLDSGD